MQIASNRIKDLLISSHHRVGLIETQGYASMPKPKDSARQPIYLYEMMQRIGIEPGEDVVPRLASAWPT
jgi:hypothetical protein